jgi:hypothetical protein
MKPLKPFPHAVIDYVWAAKMIAAPWLLGFSRNKRATAHAVAAGAGVIGLSLMTRYPLGAAKFISFPVHGVIETAAAVNTMLAPWTLGFADDERAKWLHVLAGAGTLAVVALTDYRAAEAEERRRRMVEAARTMEVDARPTGSGVPTYEPTAAAGRAM